MKSSPSSVKKRFCCNASRLFTSPDKAVVAAMFQRVLPRIPLGRVGTPADVAGWIVFLASEQAAFVTGQTLCVNGGLTPW